MTSALSLLQDAFGRVRNTVHSAVDGLSEAELTGRIDPDANSIGWLVWHLSRVQDDHIAEVAGGELVWTAGGWADRFALPFEPSATGYGQSSDEVGAVRGVDAETLLGYADAVLDRTSAFLATLDDADLSRIIDTSWDPPVTLGVRLVSVISDDLQHAGQAAFVRGALERRA